jgi:hypothetical protein
MRIDPAPDAGGGGDAFDDAETLEGYCEKIGARAEIAAAWLDARAEGTRGLAEHWEQWADRDLENEFMESLRAVSPDRLVVLVGPGAHSYAEEARAFAQAQPDTPMRAQILRGIDQWDTYESDMQHVHSLEFRAERFEHLSGALEGLNAAMENAARALQVLSLAHAMFAYLTAFRRSQRVQAAADFASSLINVLQMGQDLRVYLITRSLEARGLYGSEAQTVAARAERVFGLGRAFAKANIALNLIVAGYDLWKMHHTFEQHGDTLDYEQSRLEALGAALTVIGMVTPPPIDAACAAVGMALQVMNVVIGYLWNFYFDPELQRIEKLKAKCALSTELAKRPRLYLTSIELDPDTRVVAAQAPARITQSLWSKASRSGRPICMEVHKYQDDRADGSTQALPWVPLGSRARLPSDWRLRDELDLDPQPLTYAQVFGAVSFTPQFDAQTGSLRLTLPADLVPVPEWGRESTDQGEVGRARLATLRRTRGRCRSSCRSSGSRAARRARPPTRSGTTTSNRAAWPRTSCCAACRASTTRRSPPTAR